MGDRLIYNLLTRIDLKFYCVLYLKEINSGKFFESNNNFTLPFGRFT